LNPEYDVPSLVGMTVLMAQPLLAYNDKPQALVMVIDSKIPVK